MWNTLNTLQHDATHCNTMQRTAKLTCTFIFPVRLWMSHEWVMSHVYESCATRCNTLQHTVTHSDTLQHTATHCNTLQHIATCCNTWCPANIGCLHMANTLQHVATHYHTLQRTATHYNQLQHTSTCCNISQTHLDPSPTVETVIFDPAT